MAILATKHVVSLPSHVYFDSIDPTCFTEASSMNIGEEQCQKNLVH